MSTARESSALAVRSRFAGSVITPDDPPYDEERTVFNAMIDRHPAVIAECRTQQDVARAILFGRGLGLAAARTGTDFPVPWRTAPWVAHPFGLWSDPADDERGRRWAQQTREDVREWSAGAVYLNFIGDEGDQRVVSGFGSAHYRRLSKVKAAYDPENVLHLNHNIEPADPAA